jgi:hypothetical protein
MSASPAPTSPTGQIDLGPDRIVSAKTGHGIHPGCAVASLKGKSMSTVHTLLSRNASFADRKFGMRQASLAAEYHCSLPGVSPFDAIAPSLMR